MEEESAEIQGEVSPEENTGEVVETEESATSEQGDTPAEPEKPKEPKGVQKRINELTSNWRTAERDRDYWRDLAIKNQQEPPKQQEQPAETPQGKPDVAQFESYEAYLDALADWKVDQRLSSIEQERTQAQEQEARSRSEMEFRVRESTFAESHPDYQAVVTNPALAITEDMYNAALSSEKGPEILYHLGQNPEEAIRVAGMSPVQQAMELGRIEAAMSRPARTQTSAPEPVAPLTGNSTAQATDPSKMTADEWRVWREQQVAERTSARKPNG